MRPAPLQSRPVTAPLPDLILYGRPGCHLCEDAHDILEALLARRAETGLPVPVVAERNIEDDAGWHERYVFTIPVIALADRELELATSAVKIGRFLAENLDGAVAG
jgi:hypothetical protein